MDFSTLGVSVKRDGTVETVRDLEKLADVAPKAEKAVEGLNRTSRDNAAVTYAKNIDNAARSLRGFDAIAAKAAQQAAYATQQISGMTMRDLRADDITAYGREMDQLRAKFNPLFAASKQYESSLDEINYAHRVGAISTQEQQAAIMRLDAQYEMAAQAANKLTAANKSMAGSFHTTNMLFQLQDIGMMTALGQAPFALAMQQGPQVVGIMHQLGNSRAIIQALGGAVLGLLNPLSLATIAAIGLGAAGVQAFMGWVQSAGPVRRTMEEHSEWLGALLEGYDDLNKSVKDYIENASRMPASLTRLEISRGLNDDLARLAEVQSAIDNFSIRADAAFQLPWQTLNRDLDVLRDLKGQLDAGTLSSEQFAEKMLLISMNGNVDGQVRDLARGLYDAGIEAAELEARIGGAQAALVGLSDEALLAAQRMGMLNETFAILGSGGGTNTGLQNIMDEGVDALEALRKMVPEIRTTKEIAGDLVQTVLDTLPTGAARQEAEALFNTIIENEAILTARREANRAAGRKQRDPYGDLTRGAYEFIAAQQTEQQALGMTAEAAQRLRFEQDLLNKAANDNIKLTPAMRDELIGLAAQMAATEAQTKMLTQAANDNAALWGQAQDGVSGVLKTWMKGGDILDTISNKLVNIADMLIDMAVRNLFMGAFGGGGANAGGIFSWIGKLFGFADGGYTGNTGRTSVAGVVHGGEYVFSAPAVDRIGLGNLEGMHRSARGYQSGGYVTPTAYTPANSNNYLTIRTISEVRNGNLMPVMTEVAGEVAGQTVAQASPAIVGASVQQANKSAPSALARHQQQRGGADYRTM